MRGWFVGSFMAVRTLRADWPQKDSFNSRSRFRRVSSFHWESGGSKKSSPWRFGVLSVNSAMKDPSVKRDGPDGFLFYFFMAEREGERPSFLASLSMTCK